MLIILLSYFGGVLTIFSPCVLPVLPFIFAKSDQPFRKSGLPILVGMAITFSLVATLSAAGGSWIGRANEYGRVFAIAIFSLLGLSLIFPKIAERLFSPITKLGAKLQKNADSKGGFFGSLLLGVSVGLLWAPCTGPILGLVLASASLEKSYTSTFGLLLAFACGSATSLSIAIFASSRFLNKLKRGLGAEEWIKRALGIVVLAAVLLIGLGLDTRLLAKFSYINTSSLEQKWVDHLLPKKADKAGSGDELADEGPAYDFKGAIDWINSKPISIEDLRGKVVLVDFWTYSCINCLRTLPYLKKWYAKYKDQGLVVIGVHSPEFAFEKEVANVKQAVSDLALTYPIAVDSELAIWSDYNNQYWPAHYFIDIHGHIRHHHFGEANYEESERVIQKLLQERNAGTITNTSADLNTTMPEKGVEALPSQLKNRSPETYLGYERHQRKAGTPDLILGQIQKYSDAQSLELNQWSISGQWEASDQSIAVKTTGGTLSFQFRARDLHLVLGLTQKSANHPHRFRVTIDGKAPGENHGSDTDENGYGVVKAHRLYQMIRQKDGSTEHKFQVEFLDPGVEAYAFTFG